MRGAITGRAIPCDITESPELGTLFILLEGVGDIPILRIPYESQEHLRFCPTQKAHEGTLPERRSLAVGLGGWLHGHVGLAHSYR